MRRPGETWNQWPTRALAQGAEKATPAASIQANPSRASNCRVVGRLTASSAPASPASAGRDLTSPGELRFETASRTKNLHRLLRWAAVSALTHKRSRRNAGRRHKRGVRAGLFAAPPAPSHDPAPTASVRPGISQAKPNVAFAKSGISFRPPQALEILDPRNRRFRGFVEYQGLIGDFISHFFGDGAESRLRRPRRLF